MFIAASISFAVFLMGLGLLRRSQAEMRFRAAARAQRQFLQNHVWQDGAEWAAFYGGAQGGAYARPQSRHINLVI